MTNGQFLVGGIKDRLQAFARGKQLTDGFHVEVQGLIAVLMIAAALHVRPEGIAHLDVPGHMLIPGCLNAAHLVFTEFFKVIHDGPPALLQRSGEVPVGDLQSAA